VWKRLGRRKRVLRDRWGGGVSSIVVWVFGNGKKTRTVAKKKLARVQVPSVAVTGGKKIPERMILELRGKSKVGGK